MSRSTLALALPLFAAAGFALLGLFWGRRRPEAWALAAPALLVVAREAAFAYPAGSPEPKVFLDRVVTDARAGREDRALAALENGAARYPGSAPTHLSHAALLESAGMSAAACAALARASAVVAPLGEHRTELTDRIHSGLSACN